MMMVVFKIFIDFEWMGDNVVSIVYICLRVKINDNYVFICLKIMGKLVMFMLEDLNNVIRNKDLLLIKEVIERDEDIDDLYVNIVNISYLIDNDLFVVG